MPAPTHDPELAPYAGRWIARLGGQVVGQGGTPQQALQAARAARHKETPEVIYVPPHTSLTFSPILERVQAILPPRAEVYLVGGAVRDAFLNLPSKDLDFAVPKDALKLARKVADKLHGAYYKLDEEHETGRVVLVEDDGSRYELDFAVFRGDDLDADLRGRDFTLNAMAVPALRPDELLDPLGGLNDMMSHQLRACGPSAMQDDPVRTLRAVRMAAKYELMMVTETRQQVKAAAADLESISPERIRDEFFKILALPNAATSVRALELLGILAQITPELADLKAIEQSTPHVADVWNHTLHAVGHLETVLGVLDEVYPEEGVGDLHSGLTVLKLGRYRNQITEHLNTDLNTERHYRPLLKLASLFHDSGKPHTKSVEPDGRIRFIGHEQIGSELVEGRGMLLHLSNAEIERLRRIVKHHMRPHLLVNDEGLPSRKAVYRFWRDTGDAGVDVCLLSLADLLATYETTLTHEKLERHLDILRTLLEAYWEHPEEQVRPPALLEGSELMKTFALEPGPVIGELLEMVREGQATGEVATKGDAFQLIETWLKKHNSA